MKTKRSLASLATILPVALFATLTPSVAKAQFYGTQVAPFTDSSLLDPALASQAISLHAQTLRFFIPWWDVEQTEGSYYFSSDVDSAVATLIQAGVNIEVILGYGNQYYPSYSDSWFPQNTTAFANYCYAVVNHFNSSPFAAGSIKYWEVWDEPDNLVPYGPGGPASEYAPLLKAAYTAIHTAQPNAQVLMGGLTRDNEAYLDTLYGTYGIKDYFDIANYHEYDCPGTANPATDIPYYYSAWETELNKYYDGSKPVWITEFGYLGEGAADPRSPCSGGGTISNSTQANLLTEAFNAFASMPNIQVAVWYPMNDYTYIAGDPGQQMGLFDTSNNPKPDAASFVALSSGSNLLFNQTWATGDLSNWPVYVTTGSSSDASVQAYGGGGPHPFNGDPYYLVNSASSAAYNLEAYQRITDQPVGQPFTAQVWAYTQANASGWIGVQDQGNGWASLCGTSIPAGNGGWYLYSCTGTVPSDGDLQFNLVGSSSTGSSIYWDNASITFNVLANPTWDTGDLTNWPINVTTGSSSDASVQAYGGGGPYTFNGDPYYLVNSASSAAYNLEAYQRITGLPPGQLFTAQVYAYTQANASGGIGVQDQGNSWGNLCTYQTIPSGTLGWNLYSCTGGQVGSDGDLQFNLVGSSSTGSSIYWDNASITFNVLANPTWATDDKTGWTGYATTGLTTYAYAQATGGGGIYSEDGGPYYLANWSTSAYNISEYQNFTGLTSGGSFTASVWAQSSPGATSQFLVQDGFGNTTLCWRSISPGTGGWNLYTCSGTVPGDGKLAFVLNGVSPAGSDWTEWDNASLTVN